MISKQNILELTFVFIFISGFVSLSYFACSYIQFMYWTVLYSSSHNMTTGCMVNSTTCDNQLSCYSPFYKQCTLGGSMGVFVLIFPIWLMSIGLLALINSMWVKYSPTLLSDEYSILVTFDKSNSVVYFL